MSLRFMEDLFAYINGTGNTRLGRGLGLECTTSLFFFSEDPLSASWFKGLRADATERPGHAQRLGEYVQAGWIDSNHAFGDFRGKQLFARPHAERAYEALSSVKSVLPIFSNHGNVVNRQNIGRDYSYHQGDRPDHEAYHTDLFDAAQMRYVWTDSMILPRLLRRRAKWASPVLGRPRPLLKPTELQDRQHFLGFDRLRNTGENAPNLSSFRAQLATVNWDAVREHQAGIVCYQHLGVLNRTAGRCEPATVDAVRARPEVYLAPFRWLAEEHFFGRLWVSGLARFLRYVELIERLQVKELGNGSLSLEGLDSADWSEEHLGGLTVYVDTTRRPEILWREKLLQVQHNGPDETGRYSITIPQRPMERIW